LTKLAPLSKSCLKTTDKEEEESHSSRATEEERTTAPFVDVDDRWDGHGDVEDVLDGGGDQVGAGAGDACTFKDVDNIVPNQPF
jgi:hypothetical protein